jgi:curved DNA-binding protein CbpA
MKTLYAVLGAEPDADQGDLENAYLRLKARYSQAKLDSDENARIQFQGITQAYKTLSDPDTRAAYDKRLAKAGVRTTTMVVDEHADGWLSTRYMVVGGLIVLMIAGMWFYNAREQTRIQKDIVDRTLRLVEQEKQREAEQREAEEQRRQMQASNSQQRQDEMRERQLRNEAAASIRDAQNQSQRAESQVMAAQRQQQYEQQNRDRMEQAAKQRAAYEAERRVQNDKQQLRSMCMQRYNRPDC